jgi:CIC family chloride channel protein
MNHKVRTVTLEDDLEYVQDLMLEKQHFALPILDESRKLLGIISIQDLRKIDKKERKSLTVKDLYSNDKQIRNVEVAYPEETVHQLIQRMQEKHISNLPVIKSDGGRELVGIISKSDLIKAYKQIVSEELRRREN